MHVILGTGLIKNTATLCVSRRQVTMIFVHKQILEKWDYKSTNNRTLRFSSFLGGF